MTSKPALVSFGTSSGTSATRRSPRADSFGMLTIICAGESRGRTHLIVGYLDNRSHSLHLFCSRPLFITVERKAHLPPARVLKLIGCGFNLGTFL